MRHDFWIYSWFLRLSLLYAINFSTQYKYEEQTNLLMKVKRVVYSNFTSQLRLIATKI